MATGSYVMLSKSGHLPVGPSLLKIFCTRAGEIGCLRSFSKAAGSCQK